MKGSKKRENIGGKVRRTVIFSSATGRNGNTPESGVGNLIDFIRLGGTVRVRRAVRSEKFAFRLRNIAGTIAVGFGNVAFVELEMRFDELEQRFLGYVAFVVFDGFFPRLEHVFFDARQCQIEVLVLHHCFIIREEKQVGCSSFQSFWYITH